MPDRYRSSSLSVSSSVGSRRTKNYLNLYLFHILLYFLLNSAILAQPKTNLDIFYMMVDSSVNSFISQVPPSDKNIKLILNLGDRYSFFNNKIINEINSSEKKLIDRSNDAITVNYVIENINVDYGEIFRDGFFGDYLITRNLLLKGNYLIGTNSALFNEFSYSFNDTIKFDEINLIENGSFEFTRGKIPAEPFFSSLFEPIVAVGTTAFAVILFFTIRSK